MVSSAGCDYSQKFLIVKTNASTTKHKATTRRPHSMYRRRLVSEIEGYRMIPIKMPIAQPCMISLFNALHLHQDVLDRPPRLVYISQVVRITYM